MKNSDLKSQMYKLKYAADILVGFDMHTCKWNTPTTSALTYMYTQWYTHILIDNGQLKYPWQRILTLLEQAMGRRAGRCINTLRPRQHGCHFPDDIFRCVFLNENVWIAIDISLSFVPKGPIDKATSHYLNQWWLVYWRIYASLSLNELRLRISTHFYYTTLLTTYATASPSTNRPPL